MHYNKITEQREYTPLEIFFIAKYKGMDIPENILYAIGLDEWKVNDLIPEFNEVLTKHEWKLGRVCLNAYTMKELKDIANAECVDFELVNGLNEKDSKYGLEVEYINVGDSKKCTLCKIDNTMFFSSINDIWTFMSSYKLIQREKERPAENGVKL